MITSAFTFFTVLLAIAGGLKLVEYKSDSKLFTILPAIVILYFVIMLLSTLGLWQKSTEITDAYSSLKSNILPAMIFLMLLKADLRQIKKLGGKIVLAFFSASVSIGVAFVVAFMLFLPSLEPDSWKTFAALSGSWMGGMGNMAAIQLALDVPDSRMGYTLIIDSIDYALWVMLLLALVPHAKLFDRWIGTSSEKLDTVAHSLAEEQCTESSSELTTALLILLSLSLLVSVVTQSAASMLPTTTFFSETTWTVLIVTILGAFAAMTPIRKLQGSEAISNIMLYIIVALIASRANFYELTEAPLYIFMGMVILFIHGVLMVLFAKLFKFDLFTCGIASLANIGGVASAPILAAAYSRALIPVGVLMALIGYIVGTAGGLLVGKVLSMLV
ncbi:DUF819 domain-containing protein [Thalassotalea sp. PP2-459]|uniref:DUF819 family protein n=1 Tax=Thalassotalea sp. PP2-459 TaxID=1742724 RepID=UPI0009421E6B|nr:DUF819 family protein [Thalassotalea sp. PP2-459]OKY25180.1 hypothetical protein BI291_04000 [Thalassotalea sp. PP2-459]